MAAVWSGGHTAPAAENAMTPPAATTAENFFDPAAIDFAAILAPPPAAGSVAAEADMTAVLMAQAWRTPEQVDWAKRVAAADFLVLFAEGLLPAELNRENCPQLVALFRGVFASCAPVSEAAKKRYARPRPFAADTRVEPCVEPLTSDSYPSGHAQAARIWLEVLGEFFPAQKAELQLRAQRIAWGRVLGGVHYPTDLVAGERLGEALLKEMRKSPAFRARLEKCRAEISLLTAKKAA